MEVTLKGLSRRKFLNGTVTAGACVAAHAWLGNRAWPLPDTPAGGRVVIDSSRRLAQLPRNIFGSFIEHLGRAVYGGIYEPGSKFADSNG